MIKSVLRTHKLLTTLLLLLGIFFPLAMMTDMCASEQSTEKASSHVPSQSDGTIRCVILSDTHGLHGRLPKMPNGDVLIHLGDVANRGNLSHIRSFTEWLVEQPHPHKILIGGNHDRDLKNPDGFSLKEEYRAHANLLQNEIINVGGLRILGVSWETIEQHEPPLDLMAKTYDQLPIHLLLTHHRSRDMSKLRETLGIDVHLYGHVHRGRGVIFAENDHVEINCSTMPFMKPVVIDFTKSGKIMMVHLPDPGHRAAFVQPTLYRGLHF